MMTDEVIDLIGRAQQDEAIFILIYNRKTRYEV